MFAFDLLKPSIYIKHNLPNKLGARILSFVMLFIGLILVVAALLFTALFAVVSLPILGVVLYRFNKFRKRTQSLQHGHHQRDPGTQSLQHGRPVEHQGDPGIYSTNFEKPKTSKTIDVKEWKVIAESSAEGTGSEREDK